jgi:hypothetical protein
MLVGTDANVPQTGPQSWPARIAACWRRTAESIIETGRLLIEAKAALEHGEWQQMIETELPFDATTCQRLMGIGGDRRLANPAILPLLPGQWTKLHRYHKLDDEAFERRIREDAPINGARSIMGSRQEPDDSLDYFPTPPWATRALIEFALPELGFVGRELGSVWEPACGEGHIAAVLKEYTGTVYATDVFDYGTEHQGRLCDFLDPSNYAPHVKPGRYDWIITNPPFDEKAIQFVLRALDLAEIGVAMFVRLQWIEGVERYETLFKPHPPTLFAPFVERVNLCKGRWDPDGGTATAYCWLVWIKGVSPRPPFWIPPGCRKALTLPTDRERFAAWSMPTDDEADE